MTNLHLPSENTKYYIPFGGFGTSLGAIVILVPICWVLAVIGLNNTPWAYVAAVLIFLIIYFIPIKVAADIKDRIPEIAALDKELKKGSKIRHPFFWVIVLITIIFGGTLVVWFIALIWAHWPGNVIVPEVILKNLQSEQNFDNQQNVEPDHIQSSDESEKSNFSTETNDSIESKIAKINELLNKGLITQEEFDSKKQSIIDSI
jgi:Ca2+/Na+ antiporter